jgi:propionyl-CoA carboxylase alpha chain
MFKKILIANRGEIALRIIRTCRKMGIKTVAIYSEADTNSLHVTAADEAVYIGPSPANQSYLSMPRIIDAIRVTGADGVHPGYGFLSENPDFVEAVRRTGAKFIGPSSEAMRRMGDKIEAKLEAKKAKVSTVPGYEGKIDSAKEAHRIAAKIGFPVMFKAAAGGGGKGMRIVRAKEEVDQAFRLTTSEAKKSFGDDRVFIEKYIDNPRHIEIQIMADKHGNVLCLGERECSIQRHNQKVVEEAPSPFLDEKTRKKMYEQSVALAKLVGYSSAGTVEFISDQEKNFYFLEMNTRLQVEHPVTEYITGLDLVEWMIRIADGEKLPITQEDLKLNGWAIECRVYAEDPQRGFLPSVGRITEYKEPEKTANVRIDSGVYAGGEVSMFYDAMISKLITYGQTRAEAIKNMQQALSSYVISGVSHNISFLEALMSHPRFAEGRLSTKFIEQEYPGGFSGAAMDEVKTRNLVAVGVFVYLKDAYRAAKTTGQLQGRERQISTRWVVSVDDQDYWVNVRPRPDGYEIQTNEQRFSVYAQWVLGSRLFQGQVDGKLVNVHITNIPGGYLLTHGGSAARITVRSPRVAELGKHMPKSTYTLKGKNVLAPISGIVTSIKVSDGEKVLKGQELLILEAMKMENVLYAERDATVSKILTKAGTSVQVNDTLIEFGKDEVLD